MTISTNTNITSTTTTQTFRPFSKPASVDFSAKGNTQNVTHDPDRAVNIFDVWRNVHHPVWSVCVRLFAKTLSIVGDCSHTREHWSRNGNKNLQYRRKTFLICLFKEIKPTHDRNDCEIMFMLRMRWVFVPFSQHAFFVSMNGLRSIHAGTFFLTPTLPLTHHRKSTVCLPYFLLIRPFLHIPPHASALIYALPRLIFPHLLLLSLISDCLFNYHQLHYSLISKTTHTSLLCSTLIWTTFRLRFAHLHLLPSSFNFFCLQIIIQLIRSQQPSMTRHVLFFVFPLFGHSFLTMVRMQSYLCASEIAILSRCPFFECVYPLVFCPPPCLSALHHPLLSYQILYLVLCAYLPRHLHYEECRQWRQDQSQTSPLLFLIVVVFPRLHHHHYHDHHLLLLLLRTTFS